MPPNQSPSARVCENGLLTGCLDESFYHEAGLVKEDGGGRLQDKRKKYLFLRRMTPHTQATSCSLSQRGSEGLRVV